MFNDFQTKYGIQQGTLKALQEQSEIEQRRIEDLKKEWIIQKEKIDRLQEQVKDLVVSHAKITVQEEKLGRLATEESVNKRFDGVWEHLARIS